MLSSIIQQALAQQDFDTVEAEWLAHLDTSLDDLNYFLEVAQALVDHGQGELSRVLLELVDEELKGGELWSARLNFLRRVGRQLLEPAAMHGAVLESLRGHYGANPNLEELIEIAGLNRGTPGEPKMWSKLERLESLLAFEVGTIVAMEGKGVGRIVEINLALESLKIDFERQQGIMVGFRVVGKLLQALPSTHILRRKVEEPEAVQALRDQNPAELLRITLSSYDQPLSGAKVREVLSGVVPEAKWNSWWTRARKHPQVVSSGGSRHTYSWAESTEDADDALWRAFQKAEPRGKMEALRRALDRDAGLRKKMVAELSSLVSDVRKNDPGTAFEVWSTLDKTGELPPADQPTHGPQNPREWLHEVKDLRGFFVAIRSRTVREQAYSLLRQARQDWSAAYREALTVEEDPKLLELLTGELQQDAAQDYRQFITQTLSQPRKSPGAFTWLAERASEDEELRQQKGYRLLQQILMAMNSSDFSAFRSRLTSLVESGGTIPRILSQLTEDHAKEAFDLISRSSGLAQYQKDPLRNAIQLRFPQLREQKESPLYATAASLEAKRAQLKELLEVEIPANRRAIEEARAMGDLRENFEYKSARQRHEYLASRTSALHAELARAQVLDTSNIDSSQVRVGTVVGLSGADTSRSLTILGPWESQPEQGVVSYESDLAREILGKEVGDRVEISGEEFEVVTIDPYRE